MSDQSKYEISPLKLWSPLQSQLATCGLNKASPQQWIGTIRNLQKKGVSAIEIQWSWVMRWLGEVPESGKNNSNPAKQLLPVVYLDELLDYLAEKPPCELVLQRLVSIEYVPQVRYIKQPRPAKLPPVVVLHGRREIRLLQYIDRAFGIHITMHIEVDDGLFGRHRYWSVAIPRGRKKISAEPVARKFLTGQAAQDYGRRLIQRMARRLGQEGFVGTLKNVNLFTPYVLPGGANYTEWLITAPNLPVEYFGEHFDLPNIIAHVRTTERIAPLGEKLLVMEEIQSDWNQTLRAAIQMQQEAVTEDDGENLLEWDEDTPPQNPYLNHWLDAALRAMLLLAAQRNFDGLVWLPGKLHAERFYWANAEGLQTFYDRLVPAAMQKLAAVWGRKIETSYIETLTRRYRVRQKTRPYDWCVQHVASGAITRESFSSHAVAEDYRRTLEEPVQEEVHGIFLTTAIRHDLLNNGLPYLGAIEKRKLLITKGG